MDVYKYFFISTAILSFSYLMFLFIFRKETNFRLLRFFILTIIFTSLLIPFNTLKFDAFIPNTRIKTQIEAVSNAVFTNTNDLIYLLEPLIQIQNTVSFITWTQILKYIYFTITLLLLIRILFSLFAIYLLYYKTKKEKIGKLVIIKHKSVKPPFSFFNWIFIYQGQFKENELEKIIAHEKIHVFQYHSIDIIIIELFSSIFWFNPLVWNMKNKLKLVHEYLADEGALKTGINKHCYQATLINQVAGGQILNLTSNFNQSIKKRIMMITKVKNSQKSIKKVVGFILIVFVLFVFVGIINGQENNKVETAIELPKMNILYIGVENPVKIASFGYRNSELDVTIDNGEIEEIYGEYIITVTTPGITTLTVSSDGKEIHKTEFRVKRIPNAATTSNFDKSQKNYAGKISKKELLHWGGIQVIYKYLDLDLDVPILHYLLIFAPQGSEPIVFNSKSTTFTGRHIKQINALKKGDRLFFEKIIVLENGENARKMRSVALEIE